MSDAIDSIESFAAILARLSDGFAEPAAVLAQAGLTLDRWQKVSERWTARLGEEGGALAERFSTAYAGAKAALDRRVQDEKTLVPDPDFVGAEAQPWREEARSVVLSAPRVTETEGTMECPACPVPSSVLPFVESAPASPPRGRLHRFDPQTGLPLPAPVWVDLPLSPSLKP